MVNYQCYRCGYTTNDKTRMNRHISRIKSLSSYLKGSINFFQRAIFFSIGSPIIRSLLSVSIN